MSAPLKVIKSGESYGYGYEIETNGEVFLWTLWDMGEEFTGGRADTLEEALAAARARAEREMEG